MSINSRPNRPNLSVIINSDQDIYNNTNNSNNITMDIMHDTTSSSSLSTTSTSLTSTNNTSNNNTNLITTSLPTLVRPHTSYLKNGNILAITPTGMEMHNPNTSTSSSSSRSSSSTSFTFPSSSSASQVITLKPEDFTFGDEIGRGASSRVIAGIHNPSNTPVALKLISVYDNNKKDQILREIAILYDSDCDCLIGFHGAFLLKEGYIALVLEYMDCGTLSNLLNMLALASISPPSSLVSYDKSSASSSSSSSSSSLNNNSTNSSHSPKRVPEPVAAAIGFQLLWACAYLKIEKRLHRDIKPSNILINSTGYVKLSDFGLATALMNSLVGAYSVVGTCRYMAPERILRNDPELLSSLITRASENNPHKMDDDESMMDLQHQPNKTTNTRITTTNNNNNNNNIDDENNNLSYSYPADIWSVGLVIYEAATGTSPFGDCTGTYIEITESILESSEIITLPNDIQHNFTSYFLPFIQSCLMRDPNNRATAEELLNSPWFQMWNISNVDDACSIMAEYLHSIFGVTNENSL